MLDFFAKVLGYIESFFDYFVSFLESLMTALEVTVGSVLFPMQLASMLPTFLGSCVIIVTALAVVKFIVGR